MKTTNYEISKQLAEAGFRAKTDFCWYEYKTINGSPNINLCYIGDDCDFDSKPMQPPLDERSTLCFDLETILEALPPKIARGEGRSPTSSFIFTKNGMGYAQKPQIEFQEFINRQVNESLADTVAKLWLKLKKEGLV